MKTRSLRILGAVLAALLPACGGGGEGSVSEKPKKALAITLKKPPAGKTFTAPATISLKAVAADPANVAKMEFIEGAARGADPTPNTWAGGNVVGTSTHPPFQATWADAPEGVHMLVAVATDSQGIQTFSNTVTISVLAPGENPSGWVPVATVWAPGPMSFVDAHRGWVAGVGAILHTDDGGATWVEQLRVPPFGFDDIQFIDAHRGWVLGIESGTGDGIVFRTTDGGVTWTRTSLSTSVEHVGLHALSFVDADTGWIVGSGFNLSEMTGGTAVMFATKDGGMTWTLQPTGIPDLISLNAVRFVDHLNGWALGAVFTPQSGFAPVILHTSDGGLTWTEQRRMLAVTNPNVGFHSPEFVSATTGWVLWSSLITNGVLFTSDGGTTWTEQNVPEGGALARISSLPRGAGL